MLLLSRKPGESIIIGDDITVQILSVDRKHVQLGISAPACVTIHREEIYDEIHRRDNEKGKSDS